VILCRRSSGGSPSPEKIIKAWQVDSKGIGSSAVSFIEYNKWNSPDRLDDLCIEKCLSDRDKNIGDA
jgi:hypothetical protein